MKMIDKIAYLHLRNGKILSTRSKGKEAYYIPGGKREGQESDIETLIREVKIICGYSSEYCKTVWHIQGTGAWSC